MKPEDRIRIQHMLDAAQEACEFMGDVSFEEFKNNRLLANGIVRSFEVTGEAASQMSSAWRESHGQIPGMARYYFHAQPSCSCLLRHQLQCGVADC